jgi:guanylate kinase
MLNGQDVPLQLDVQGATTVRKLLGQDAVFIFMVTKNEMALVKRLVERKTESFGNVVCNFNFVICIVK